MYVNTSAKGINLTQTKLEECVEITATEIKDIKGNLRMEDCLVQVV